MSFIVQEDDQIGSDKWYGLGMGISKFDYELGYTYDIEVKKKHIENPMIDQPSVEYSLNRILSKTKAPADTRFDITLTIKYDNGFLSLVTKNEDSKFSLLGKTVIDCGNLCDTLKENIDKQIGLLGTFTHIDSNSIRLIKLEPHDR